MVCHRVGIESEPCQTHVEVEWGYVRVLWLIGQYIHHFRRVERRSLGHFFFACIWLYYHAYFSENVVTYYIWRWLVRVCILRRQGSMSDACHIAQFYYSIMPSCWVKRGGGSECSRSFRSQVGLVDAVFDVTFILVCAMWHKALLHQMDCFCIPDNCHFPWWAITRKSIQKK